MTFLEICTLKAGDRVQRTPKSAVREILEVSNANGPGVVAIGRVYVTLKTVGRTWTGRDTVTICGTELRGWRKIC